jgi:hypothetical protein
LALLQKADALAGDNSPQKKAIAQYIKQVNKQLIDNRVNRVNRVNRY